MSGESFCNLADNRCEVIDGLACLFLIGFVTWRLTRR